MSSTQNIINHIVLVLDASASMNSVSKELIKVADNQVEYLAVRSKDLDQETRITVYQFDADGFTSGYSDWRGSGSAVRINCLIYDMDVLRVPSIAKLYKTGGSTPLIDGTLTALNDLAMTPEKYGEHSFLVYVLTDGAENASHSPSSELKAAIEGLPDHWTVAAFVPDQVAVHEAKRFGFPAQNISVWDTTKQGISEVGAKIRETTENFMQARAHAKKTGTVFRGSKSLFTLKQPSLVEVRNTITPIGVPHALWHVSHDGRIDDFVATRTGKPYVRGQAYYELSKREEIQPQKKIALLGKNGFVYAGDAARGLLGLPDDHVKVSPGSNSDYTIFVQSTSDNRKLIAGTRVLLLEGVK